MNNPKYTVTISYQTPQVNGQTESNIAGITYSSNTYSGEYFIASMHELKIYATGSSYNNALSNLLLIATSSTTNYINPALNETKTW